MQLIEKKLSKLEEKKQKIENEILELQKKKNEEFLFLLDKIPSFTLEPMTLIGGLLHLIDEANEKTELKEKWRSAAEKFCKRLPSQKRTKVTQSSSQKAA